MYFLNKWKIATRFMAISSLNYHVVKYNHPSMVTIPNVVTNVVTNAIKNQCWNV